MKVPYVRFSIKKPHSILCGIYVGDQEYMRARIASDEKDEENRRALFVFRELNSPSCLTLELLQVS